ncbi:MAG: hypothetical protein J5855_10040, partial [Mailhella sp.]|nr:hypothetical protein [Mailhella sp.]
AEQKSFDEQPEKEKAALRGMGRTEGRSGRELYDALSRSLGSPKAASLSMNEAGIKGITYMGGRDGRCFVVFDDEAIDILETYYQRGQHGNARGSMQVIDGRYYISLFEAADLSTLAHEFSHVQFEEMQRMVEEGTADEQTVRDWETLKGWLGQLDDEEAFRKEYELTASKNPRFHGMPFEQMNEEERQKAREICEKEMLGRAFEQYLREGKAPSKKMEGIFRRFAKWLQRVYRDAAALHVEITDEVRQVFDRMTALDEEMDNVAREAGWREESDRILDAVGLTGQRRLEAQTMMRDAIDDASAALRAARDEGRAARMKQWAKAGTVFQKIRFMRLQFPKLGQPLPAALLRRREAR